MITFGIRDYWLLLQRVNYFFNKLSFGAALLLFMAQLL